MLGIPASRKRRIFWLACENSVISDVDSPSAIFLPDDAAVRWHKHRNRLGEQKQLRCGIAWQFFLIGCYVIAENSQRQSVGLTEFASDVKPVFVQGLPTRRKCSHQTDLHCCPGLKIACRDSFPRREKY